jgi:hypothetical protein
MSRGPQVLDMECREPNELSMDPKGPYSSVHPILEPQQPRETRRETKGILEKAPSKCQKKETENHLLEQQKRMIRYIPLSNLQYPGSFPFELARAL